MMEQTHLLIDDVLEILIRDLKLLRDELDTIPEEYLWQTMPGIINSLGSLSHHMCGNLQHFIGEKLGHTGYERNIEDEFSNHQLTKDALLNEIDATITAVRTGLINLNESMLQLAMPDPPAQHAGRTIGFFLVQLCCHLSRHRGQFNYLRRILMAQ